MELPGLGKHCFYTNCHQLDFLPVTCDFCSNIFCKDHSSSDKHECIKNENNTVVENKEAIKTVPCTFEGCTNKIYIKTLCHKCGFSFCLQHRHHGPCYENDNKSKVALMKENKAQFMKAKAAVDKHVHNKLADALNSAVKTNRNAALKVRMMKTKAQAVGDPNVLPQDRVAFMIYPPLTSKSRPRAIFVSKYWPIGKCLDLFSKKFKIENNNHKPDGVKLKLFDFSNGTELDISKSVEEFIKNETLYDGGCLVFEYRTEETVKLDNNVFVLTDLSKYC